MLESLKYQLAQEKIDFKGKKVIVATSGGIDSMVLLHLLIRMETPIIVAHFNYLTREESSEDEKFVENFCNKHQLLFKSQKQDLNSLIAKEGGNFQATARKLRYQFFQDLKNELNADFIALAHHQDDQEENILINIFRGVGPKRMAVQDSNTIRPLLSFSKAEIKAYALTHHIEYKEDLSNHQNKYLRNFLRNKIIPALHEKLPHLYEKLNSFSLRYQEDQLLIESLINESDIITHADKMVIQKIKILSARHLYHILKKFGYSSEHAKEIYFSIESIGATHQSDTHHILIDRNHLIITPIGLKAKTKEFYINNLPWKNYISTEKQIQLKLDQEQNSSDQSCIYLRPSDFPLKIRYWKDGDRFQPEGMKGKSKKLKKLFVDHKIDRNSKHQIPILVNAEDIIIWVIGIQKDERFIKARDNSFRVELIIS